MTTDDENTEATVRERRTNAATAIACATFVVAMVGAAYAAVPLYELFCRVTGYGGTTQRAESAPVAPIDRQITVRFDANVAGGLNWTLKPKQRTITLNVGEVGTTAYTAASKTDRTSWGTATFNVTPFEAGSYFSKIECFCFSEQKLEPAEVADMGVTFFIDPAIAEDSNLDHVNTITLSYTMFPADPPDRKPIAARTPEAEQGRSSKRL